ncbi:DNA mismatch repair protein MutS [Myxococcota bacterium]|nr:DNA mismatch repair protein MutS [Myxococcota bacterium]
MPPSSTLDAAAPSAPVHREYERRRDDRRARAAHDGSLARRISHARLLVFLLGMVVAGIVFGTQRLPGSALWPPALGFVALVIWHDRLLRRHDDADRAAAWYDDGLARVDARFAGRGTSGERFRDPEHPYADDLDLFGVGSLFELLCRARTKAGEAVLANWLRTPAAPEALRARQQAVAELRDAIDLREELALAGERVAAGLHADALTAWGHGAPPAPSRLLRTAAFGLALASGISFGALFAGVPTLIPWLFVLALSAVLAAANRSRVRRVLRETDAPARDLELLGELVAILERAELQAPRLVELRGLLRAEGETASHAIARLERLAQLLDARRNQIFAPIGAALLFTTQVAFAIDTWRARHGRALRLWIDAVAEFEALASLACHAYEHPDDAWPVLVPGPPRLETRAAGHPLLPESRCVRNDVRLDEAQRVLVVSGSNMSGKSTLLRTLGSNVVLALAGAPVRAQALRLSPLALGASIRVGDSLQEGHSRFYSEIRRLRQIVDLTAGPSPVLFLLDEVLHGTNSHDRRIGAEAVVRSLVERGAIGLVTTHDLALAKLAESPELHAANVHFEDALIDGHMHFDYKMRPGVVTRSNAIELMRAVGLEV